MWPRGFLTALFGNVTIIAEPWVGVNESPLWEKARIEWNRCRMTIRMMAFKFILLMDEQSDTAMR